MKYLNQGDESFCMKYKINALKDAKSFAFTMSLIFLIPLTILLFFGIINNDNEFFWFTLICFLLGFVFSLIQFGSIEWYCIYDDKIVIKNFFGVVNEVYFSQVHQIVDIELPIVKRDHVRCFIFVDKKKNIKDKIFWGSVFNSKFSYVRVPVTDELIATIEETGLTNKIYIPKKLF